MLPLDKLLDRYYEDRLKLYPLEATVAGDHRYDDQLPNNITEAYRAQVKGFYTSYLEQLHQYDRNSLSAEEKTSYDVLEWECEINLANLAFPSELLPVNQFESLHLYIGQYAGGTSAQPFNTPKDYDNWLKRLDVFIQWADTAIVNMHKGMAQGYVLPKALIVKLIPQIADFAKENVQEHLFYSPIKNMPADFSADDKQRLTKAYEDMIGGKIVPVFKKMHEFLEREYLPAGRATAGINSVPDGRAFYDTQIKTYTTTDMTADQVFELGLSEVRRLSAEMEKVKRQVGFKGDLKAFFNYVRNNKALMPYSKPEQVLAHFEAIHDKMKPQLQKLFNHTPKTGFEIRRTEAFREASASAEYVQGTTDGSRPGIFYVPIPDASKYNIYDSEDLFLHEAIPGHHYQVSLQQENDQLPRFRRTLWYSAYGEGWALYAESLGQELGLYTDPYQYFGMLSAEMHRAIRLVVDAGMHAEGWSREKAIQYSLDHEAESEASIVSEIERYMAWPGQALSYKIGQLKIRELRHKAEQALGDRFDIRAFHDQVLAPGCVPLKVLERRVDDWVAEVKAQ